MHIVYDTVTSRGARAALVLYINDKGTAGLQVIAWVDKKKCFKNQRVNGQRWGTSFRSYNFFIGYNWRRSLRCGSSDSVLVNGWLLKASLIQYFSLRDSCRLMRLHTSFIGIFCNNIRKKVAKSLMARSTFQIQGTKFTEWLMGHDISIIFQPVSALSQRQNDIMNIAFCCRV